MGASLHLFNPQNDLALANGSPNFTPPKAAVDLAVAGAYLPLWYGQNGDRFLGAVNAEWFDGVRATFGIDMEPTFIYEPGYSPAPWGWSLSTRRMLENCGVPDYALPDNEMLARWRALSSRVSGAELIGRMMHALPDIVAMRPDNYAPQIATQPDLALEMIHSLGRAMLKLPWSGSGRGQQDTARTTPEELARRVGGMIQRQGAVEIAPYYDKIADFALLFDNGVYVGLSLFDTDTHGGWTGNILCSDQDIMCHLTGKAGRRIDFAHIIDVVGDILADASSDAGYAGPVGVDFMVARDAAGNVVIPPVEINWRRTMGHVSNTFVKRFMARGATGRFSVLPRVSGGITDFGHPCDCAIADGRWVSGILDLTPPGGAFRFVVS